MGNTAPAAYGTSNLYLILSCKYAGRNVSDLYVQHHASAVYLPNPFYTIIVVLGCSQLLPTENVVGIVMRSHLKVTAFLH